MNPYLIVAGDFVQTGGMDNANFELGKSLAEQGKELHLVAHRVSHQLTQFTNVYPHLVRKPLNSYLLGSPLLNQQGRFWGKHISVRGGRVIVNGGNCQWGDINWVHYVHAAYRPVVVSNWMYRYKAQIAHQLALKNESECLQRSRLVICNSQRTRQDLIERLRVPAEKLRVVYYGIDPGRFGAVTWEVKRKAKLEQGYNADQPLAVFIGALGDRRKGFDLLFAAWAELCRDRDWDCNLVVIGSGSELSLWQVRVKAQGLEERIRFLGFQRDISSVLAACDVLVHPARYEAYGLGVQEALSRGLPSLVTRSAGVAERYPKSLMDLLLNDPPEVNDLVERLRNWRARIKIFADRMQNFSAHLRKRTWTVMSGEIIEQINLSVG